ncbi:inositol 2-dehydrogenase [Pseudonocardia xishanensis]|uniref:Inositol 2-dehydrogenase n=1 Tax=Pseudonocardia xishanensis TaxID=630995 RepID=A0ABP8RY92_9PSEU
MLRVALLGCGRIGRVHATAVTAHPRARLAWVYDPIEAAAEEVAGLHGARHSTDVAAVLADPEVDAVIIASPTATHIDLLTAAVRAGKAVLCEKPIDLDIARVDACRTEIEPYAPTVMLGFNRRFDPSFREIRERVAAGEIGALEQVVIISRDPAPPPPGYVGTSGGLFRDMTIHDFDMARFVLGAQGGGEVVAVSAMGSNLISEEIAQVGDIDGAVVTLRSDTGALAQITNSRRCSFGYDQRLEAFGATGMLSAQNQLPTSVRYAGAERSEAAAPYLNFFLERYTTAYAAELDHFVAAVESGTAPSPSFADGRAALVLADAAGVSLRTGAAVRVEL